MSVQMTEKPTYKVVVPNSYLLRIVEVVDTHKCNYVIRQPSDITT